MEFEHEQHPELFTEDQKKSIQTSAYTIDMRLWRVTEYLEQSGLDREAIMLGYFNECVRIATEESGVTGAYILTCQLYWHIVTLIKKLHEATGAIPLDELPRPPPSGKPPANDQQSK